MANFPKILAIDYGTRRVGLAISQGTLAEPLMILANYPGLIEDLVRIVGEQHAEKIVVGISENEMAEKTKIFVAQLQKVLSLPVEMMDETLSSVTVHQKLAERHKGKKQYSGPIDHYAAAEILQNYLDAQ